MASPSAAEWAAWQEERRQELVLKHLPGWSVATSVQFVGGVDISTLQDSSVAGLVVMRFPSLEVVYTDTVECDCTAIPYVPGFLGFREAPAAAALLRRLRERKPELLGSGNRGSFVLLVDGNGVLHERGFGSACQIGLETDVVTVGVAKNYYHVSTVPLTREQANSNHGLAKTGDWKRLDPLEAAMVRTTDEGTKPVFVSVGHLISLPSAVALVLQCSVHRVPEPIRQADILTRVLVKQLNTQQSVE